MNFLNFLAFLTVLALVNAEFNHRDYDEDYLYSKSVRPRFWGPFSKSRVQAQTTKFEEYVKDSAEDLINKFEDAMMKATELMNKLKDQAIEKNNETFAKVLRQLEPAENAIDEIMNDPDAADIDLSKCQSIPETLKIAAFSIIENTTDCVFSKIREGRDLLKDVGVRASNVISEIKKINTNTKNCTQKYPSGLKKTVNYGYCLVVGGVKMTVALAKEIKEVVKDVTKLSAIVSTVQLHMATCLPASALKSFMSQSLNVVRNVATCAVERVHEYSQRVLPQPTKETQTFLRFISKPRNDVNYRFR